MNIKEKRQWIIKYVKKNKLDYILANEYRHKKENVLKKYSNEIQSICSIISILVIGFASIIISVQYNGLVEKQTQIMMNEQKPIINISIDDDKNGTSRLLVNNKGTDAIDCGIEVITYFNVHCNENGLGQVPIRVYFLNAIESLEYNKKDNIAEIVLYNESHPAIASLKNDLSEIIHQYTYQYWDFSFTYLIKITSYDIMNEKNIDYFVFNNTSVQRVSNEYGDSVVNEYTYMIDEEYGMKTSKESYFELGESNAERIFKYTLEKIRYNDLYSVDFETKEKYLYGEYEPDMSQISK